MELQGGSVTQEQQILYPCHHIERQQPKMQVGKGKVQGLLNYRYEGNIKSRGLPFRNCPGQGHDLHYISVEYIDSVGVR